MGTQLAIEHSETVELDESDVQQDDNWSLEQPKWEMKKLSPKHQQVAALVAQGMKFVDIAALVDYTPQYITMLVAQPLMRSYIAEKCAIAGTRLEALFAQSVEVIADTMKNGSEGGKLKAARLQLEATKRIGRPDPNAGTGASNVDRLEQLAERLIMLQAGARLGKIYTPDGQEVTDVL
jgi:hypothetical protein